VRWYEFRIGKSRSITLYQQGTYPIPPSRAGVRGRVNRSSENDAGSSATRKSLFLTSKSEMLTSKSNFLINDVDCQLPPPGGEQNLALVGSIWRFLQFLTKRKAGNAFCQVSSPDPLR